MFHISETVSEEDKFKRRAVIFGALSIFLIILAIFVGIPAFLKLVDFIGDLNSKKVEEIKDIVPPATPRFSPLPEATNSALLIIGGFTDPDTRVKINFNEGEIETQTDAEGKFLLEKLSLKQGVNTLSAVSFDESGNESQVTETKEITLDTTSPKLTIETPKSGETFEEQNLSITGTVEPDCRLTINDHLTVVENDGRFSTSFILKEGSNILIFVATDPAGNKTEQRLSITYSP